MTSKEELVICGAGQQGRVCKRLAIESGYSVVAFVDDTKTENVENVPIYQKIADVPDFWRKRFFVAIGDVSARRKFIDQIAEMHLQSVNLIDKAAYIEEGAKIGVGNYIGKLAIVYASAEIGNHNIINCKAAIATDSIVGSNCNISMGCNICAGVNIGDNSYIGCQASVVCGCTIGNDSTVGAGSVVLNDVPPKAFVAGTPAIRKERNKK